MAIEAMTLLLASVNQPHAAVVYMPAHVGQQDWQWECARCAQAWIDKQVKDRRSKPFVQDPLDVLHQSRFMRPSHGTRCGACEAKLEDYQWRSKR